MAKCTSTHNKENNPPPGLGLSSGNLMVWQLLSLLSNPIHQSQLTVNLGNPAPQPMVFNYTMKIQNPASSAGPKFIIRQVHDFHSRFQDLTELKSKVCSMFTDDIPSLGEIGHIGYFKGRQKRWLCDERELQAMYDKFKGSVVEISLWCKTPLGQKGLH